MKKMIAALALTTALTVPGLALARQVTLTTQLANYGGNNAFLAYYVTDANGKYAGSLWMAGGRERYYRHLTGWYRATRGNTAEINGITGASVGSGRRLKVTVDLSDALFDAGYQLHIDSAVEGNGESPNDVVVPLKAANSGKTVRGRNFISQFRFDM